MPTVPPPGVPGIPGVPIPNPPGIQPPLQPTPRPPVYTQPPMVTYPVMPTPPAVGVTTKSPVVRPPLWAGENLCTQPNGKFAIPESCTSYVRCTNGVQGYPALTCPDGTFFNAAYQDCISSAPESCFTYDFLNSDCKKDIGYFGVAGRCNKYVFCEDGKIKYSYECKADTYWNQSLGGCSLDKPYYCWFIEFRLILKKKYIYIVLKLIVLL